MFTNLHPDYRFQKVQDITVDFLKENLIEGLILDVDNTLTEWNGVTVSVEVRNWVNDLNSAGIKLVLLSNGVASTQSRISEMIGIPLVRAWLPKPFSMGFKSALEKLSTSKERTAVVGDIIFTDILGGNRLGLRSILVEPLSGKDFVGTGIWRFFERVFNLRCSKAESKGKS